MTSFPLHKNRKAYSDVLTGRYLLTYEDARRAYQIKSTEQVDHSYIAVQEELSEKLRLSLQQADKRILARSNYWMAKACLELGQIEEAEACTYIAAGVGVYNCLPTEAVCSFFCQTLQSRNFTWAAKKDVRW